jgi:hypothetical protein
MEALEAYTRQNRPLSYADKLVYERMVRLLLNWIDIHKIKELKVFLAQEGKEYAALIEFLEETLGVEKISLDPELFKLAWDVRQI